MNTVPAIRRVVTCCIATIRARNFSLYRYPPNDRENELRATWQTASHKQPSFSRPPAAVIIVDSELLHIWCRVARDRPNFPRRMAALLAIRGFCDWRLGRDTPIPRAVPRRPLTFHLYIILDSYRRVAARAPPCLLFPGRARPEPAVIAGYKDPAEIWPLVTRFATGGTVPPSMPPHRPLCPFLFPRSMYATRICLPWPGGLLRATFAVPLNHSDAKPPIILPIGLCSRARVRRDVAGDPRKGCGRASGRNIAKS